MISGCDKIIKKEYNEIEEAIKYIDEFIKQSFKLWVTIYLLYTMYFHSKISIKFIIDVFSYWYSHKYKTL